MHLRRQPSLVPALARSLREYAMRRIRWRSARRRMKRLRRNPSAVARALQRARRVLIVCHGNIIRSPFAARLLQQRVGAAAECPVRFDSAGLAAVAGRPAHPSAAQIAREQHVDLSDHSANLLAGDHVRRSDVIFVMDVPQLVALCERFPEARDKTFLLTSLSAAVPLEIRDPVDGDEGVFQACFEHIAAATGGITSVLAEADRA
jgi:protein-tyrosine-phosphatase